MKKPNKAEQKLLEQVKAYLESLDDTEKDEWYDTQRGFAASVMYHFLLEIGLELPEIEALPAKS